MESVEIEESSRRGLLTLRNPAGDTEHIRTEQQETDRGRDLIERARNLQGRWVLVFRVNEKASATKQVRMLAHLMDLGDGAIAVNLAKKILLDDAGGAVARAQAAWSEAGCRTPARSRWSSCRRRAPGCRAGLSPPAGPGLVDVRQVPGVGELAQAEGSHAVA
ncbi:hypothetical protein AB0D62_36350 [Streptomyces massasporeus]|uniref:hypothetical protein n=1 Tax=Streptomyces massasporeus TaxID=67324 RepID=UPI0033E85ADC